MSFVVAKKRVRRFGGYPPKHQEHVRRIRRWLVRNLLILGAASLVLSCGYLRDWPPSAVFALAPFVAFLFLLLLLLIPGAVDDAFHVAVLPYFPKSNPGVYGRTFLNGQALARQCVPLDTLARERGLEPLSAFGFADDMEGEPVVWHDAGRGLETVSGLLAALRQEPSRVDDAASVIDDLERIETSLQSARRLGVPFCLLLRRGSTASGAEMDARQGYFCYD